MGFGWVFYFGWIITKPFLIKFFEALEILNLYSGIGGNRKLWGDEHNITSVEYREDIADVYRHYFPNDTMVIGDAHQYLLNCAVGKNLIKNGLQQQTLFGDKM